MRLTKPFRNHGTASYFYTDMRGNSSETNFENGVIRNQQWKLGNISIGHNIIEYKELKKHTARNDSELVRLHFGLKGGYSFHFGQLNASYDLQGQHNNIMYSAGLDLEIHNKTRQIETFGIDFTTDSFVRIAENGNDLLKRFSDKVVGKRNSILSPEWRPNTFRMQQVIGEILNCHYTDALRDLFLLSKSIELVVLQAELYEEEPDGRYIRSNRDRAKFFEAKEILEDQLADPPTIRELSKMVQLNEYKLKKGFKELFGVTVFGYIHKMRMEMARRLLLGTERSAKEIAYDTGYSSPQHFSKAFKKEFGTTPNRMRNTPDSAIAPEE